MPDFDPFKMIMGESFEEFTKIPELEETFDFELKKLASKYPPRILGTGNRDIYVTEEERSANMHIIGAPGEGKSRFLEYNMRRDIDLGNGFCFLDPSERGDTVYNILAYCEQKNYDKVILIDPTTIDKFDKVPCIRALSSKNIKASVEGTTKALSFLFDTKLTDTRRIMRYMGATFNILATTGLSLAEAKYFSQYIQYLGHRQDIYDRVYGAKDDVYTLETVFRTPNTWEQFYSSSINMMNILWQEPLSLVFGNTNGINFQEAIADGWVILANMSPYYLNEEEAKLLGLMVVSQMFQAVRSLGKNNWKGRYYLYIDEAGRFASNQIRELLDYLRQAGIHLILAHHNFDQFKGYEQVMSAVLNSARIKLMFDTPNYDDRIRMIRHMGYGGDIPPVLAAYANRNIPKQYAVIRKHKEDPLRIRTPDVPDLPKVSDAFLQRILDKPFYKSVQQIKDEINARIIPANTKRPERREASDRSTARSAPISKPGRQSIPTDSQKPPVPKNPKPFKF